MTLEREPSIIELRPIPCTIEPPKTKLVEIDYRRDIYPYLGHEVHCIYCLRRNQTSNQGLITKEHLVPREAKKMYPESLGVVVGSRWNHIRICEPTHHLIDSGEAGKGKAGKGGKIYMLRNYGISSIVDFLAQYPRAIDPVYRGRQEKQFINLFGFLAERMQFQVELSRAGLLMARDELLSFEFNPLNYEAISTVAKKENEIDDFSKALDRVDFYMKEWQKGNFDNLDLKAA